MEEEEEETTVDCLPDHNLRKTSSTVTLIEQDVSRTNSESTLVAESEADEETTTTITTGVVTKTTFQQASVATAIVLASGSLPHCQIVTQQASADSLESESESTSLRISPRYSRLTTPHSSSSQEEDLPAKGQFLTAGQRTETARSMESLKTTSSRSFLSTSERDMRKVFSESTEAKSLESIDREMMLKRHAVSGEGAVLSLSASSEISAEKKRGLW